MIIHIIFSYDQNISLSFLCEIWIPCQASISVLCLHYRPETVHCSTKDAYTSEITFLALHPCIYLSINPSIWHFCNSLCKINILGPWTNFLDFHIFVFPRCSRSNNLSENYSSKYYILLYILFINIFSSYFKLPIPIKVLCDFFPLTFTMFC